MPHQTMPARMCRTRSTGDLRKLAASFHARRQSREQARGDCARFFTESAGTGTMRPAEGRRPAIFDEAKPVRECVENLKEQRSN